MIYFNFRKVDYLGNVKYYSLPAVKISKNFDTAPVLTESEVEEYFSDYPTITIGQIIPSFQGLTFKTSKETTEATTKYALKQNSTFKAEDGPRTILSGSPSSEYDYTNAFEMQPNYPQATMQLTNGNVPDIGSVATIYEYTTSASIKPFNVLTNGRNSRVYIGIVKYKTLSGYVNYVAIFTYVVYRNTYVAYSGDFHPDVSDHPKYGEPTDDSPYQPGGSSSPAGGGGNFGNDRTSDDIVGTIPNGSAANSLADAGIFSHYLMTASQLKTFGDWLWADNIIETLNKELIELWFGNIYEAIISLTSYPFAIGLLRGVRISPDVVYLGAYNTATASSGRLMTDAAQMDWGSITISEYWGNFLDYAPHTKIQLYLPWGTGFVDIDPNEVMNGTLRVITNIELSKGTCVHHVCTGTGSVIGTYSGFCGAQYPITSKDTSGKAIGAAIAGVSLAVAGASGAIAKEAGDRGLHALQVASSTKNAGYQELPHLRMAGLNELHREATYNAMSAGAAKVAATSSLAAARIPATFNRNGSFAPNGSALAIQYPYIIMTWPDQSVPEQYGSHVGYPSNIYISLGRLRGYTEVGAIHLEEIKCTEHEREELMSLLQGGVIL